MNLSLQANEFPAHPKALPGHAYEAAHLRPAEFRDIPELLVLYKTALGKAESQEEMTAWLEGGGALVLEDATGKMLCALRWREELNQEAQDGWRVDRVATIPEARAQGFGRWLMTKVEALAIRNNIPTLTLTLDEVRDDLLAYYQRMGYGILQHDKQGLDKQGLDKQGLDKQGLDKQGLDKQGLDKQGVSLSKRVGGTWQRKAGVGVGGNTGFGD